MLFRSKWCARDAQCGSNSVGRVRPCQGRCRRFEPGLPLHFILPVVFFRCYNKESSGCGAAWLARLLGVQEVPGSNPGSPTNPSKLQTHSHRYGCVWSPTILPRCSSTMFCGNVTWRPYREPLLITLAAGGVLARWMGGLALAGNLPRHRACCTSRAATERTRRLL